jgi:hypothetical protein
MIEALDTQMRGHVARGSGDISTATVQGLFQSATAPFSGERTQLNLSWKLLSNMIASASIGRFEEDWDYAMYADEALEDCQAEPHRVAYLKQRLVYYLQPDSRLVSDYVRDRNVQGLVPYYEHQVPGAASGASLAESDADVQGTLSLFRTQLRAATARAAQLEGQRPELPSPPAVSKVSAEAFQLTKEDVADTLSAYCQYLSYCQHLPKVAAAIVAYIDSGELKPTFWQEYPQQPRPAAQAPAAPSKPELNKPRFGTAKPPGESQEQPVSPAPSSAADEAADTGSPTATAPSAVDPEEEANALTRLQQLREDWQQASDYSSRQLQAIQTWDVYDQQLAAYNQVDSKVSSELTAVAELAARVKLCEAPSPAALAAAAAGPRATTVAGYMHPDLGVVITPSLAVYYVLRATMEAVYQLAGKLDESAYKDLLCKAGTSLRNWGGQVTALSACYPGLADEIHRGIYLRGVPDRLLRERVCNYRTSNPSERFDLKKLIQLTQRMADNEVVLLNEQLGVELQGQAASKLKVTQRLEELQGLLGWSGQEGGKRGAVRDTVAAKPQAKESTARPKSDFKTPRFSSAREFSSYLRKDCSLHPNSPQRHTNGECNMQKLQLTKAFPAFAADCLGFMAAEAALPAAPVAAPAAAPATVAYHVQQQYQPPYSDWGSEQYGTGSAFAPSEYGWAVQTVRDQRQQGLMNGGRGRGPPPGSSLRGSADPAAGSAPVRGPPQRVRGGAQIEIPMPPHGYHPCQICGFRTNHYPYPCGYAFPWCASRGFRIPTADGDPRLFQLYTENAMKMPAGVTHGSLLPRWFELHGHLLTAGQRDRVRADMAATAAEQQQGGQRYERGGMAACTILSPEAMAYCTMQEDLGLTNCLFDNGGSVYGSPGGTGSTAAATSSSSSSSSSLAGSAAPWRSNTAREKAVSAAKLLRARGGGDEDRDGYPLSFLQRGAAAPAAQPLLHGKLCPGVIGSRGNQLASALQGRPVPSMEQLSLAASCSGRKLLLQLCQPLQHDWLGPRASSSGFQPSETMERS